MNGMRKVLGFLMVLMLAAFALPAAAQKVFTLNMTPKTPSSLSAGVTGQTATASFNNISSDTGNSTIKSIKLFAPLGITITAPASGALVNVGNGYTATIQNNGSSIFLSSIQVPLKPFGPTLKLTMTVNVSCTATGLGWTTKLAGVDQVWNGSNFTGQTFAFVNTPANPSYVDTPVSGVCGTISFVNQPATAFAGYPITNTAYNNPTGAPVTVSLTINGSPALNGTQVNLAVSAGTCSITNGSASTVSGVATFSNLTSTAGTGCKLTASGGGVGPSAPSNAFDIVAPAGTLGCTSTNNFAGNPAYDPDGDGPFVGTPGIALRRHLNLDGSCPQEIPYTLSFDPDNDTASFIADKLGQQVIVEYAMVLKPSATVDGWPPARRPKLAWGPNLSNPPVFPGEYIDGLACNNNLVDSTSLPNNPPVPPYSTSLFTQYTPSGSPAQMCVSQLGWTPVGVGSVQFWLKVIDSDGFVKLP